MLKIETGIKIPCPKRLGRPLSPEREAIRKMKKGQSFVTAKSQHNMHEMARNEGKSIVTRAAGNGLIRVWLVGERKQ